MSASEKLKVLGAGFDRVTPICRKTGPKALGADAYVHAKDIHAYVDALPQIVAVVERAEREHPEPHNYWAIDADMNEIEECPTCAALTALEEALS